MEKVLFLAANPTDTARLRLDKEISKIDEKLRQAELRNQFEIAQHWGVKVSEIQGLLLRHKPNIVHFSGHGNQSSEIILENERGESHPVSVHALSQLFSELKDQIQCVVLNACYSESQAVTIAENIEYVIGMSSKISDSSAISFAFAFYQALGFGKDIKTAFNLGCIQIDLENLGEHKIPKLLEKSKGKHMARMPIKILAIGEVFENLLMEAIQLANSLQDEFVYEPLESRLASEVRMRTFKELYAPDYLDMLEEKNASCGEESAFLIVVTDSVLDGEKYSNLFGSHRAKKGIAVLTVNNVPDIIIPSNKMSSYFLYYFARYTLSFIHPKHKNHDDTRSCVFDRKINKLDILKSMKAQSICDECRKKLLLDDIRISASQFQALDKMFSLSGKLLLSAAGTL